MTTTTMSMAIMVVVVFCIVIYAITRKNIKQRRGIKKEGRVAIALIYTNVKKAFAKEPSTHFILQHSSIVISDLCASRWESTANEQQRKNLNEYKEEEKKEKILKRWLDLINPTLFCVFVHLLLDSFGFLVGSCAFFFFFVIALGNHVIIMIMMFAHLLICFRNHLRSVCVCYATWREVHMAIWLFFYP